MKGRVINRAMIRSNSVDGNPANPVGKDNINQLLSNFRAHQIKDGK
jgi:hypothetical protein